MPEFRRAVKEQSKLRLALYGPSKSGKTYTGLMIARELAGDKVALIDSEHGSSEKYADRFTFDVLTLADHHPDRYVEAIQLAALQGYGVLLIDSASHAWMGSKGILELVDENTPQGGSSFSTGWNKVRPIEARFWNSMLSADLHLIVTFRSKQQYVLEEKTRGQRTQMVPRKVGLGPIQREGLEYEFDIVGELDLDHNLTIAGSRYEQLAEGDIVPKPGRDFAVALLDALNKGEPPKPPEEAPAEKIAELRDLLLKSGQEERRVEDVFRATKATNRGVLPPDWVEKEIRVWTKMVAAQEEKGEESVPASSS
jgi:hypothetical protein